MPEGFVLCPSCNNYDIFKYDHKLEVWHFANMQHYQSWRQYSQQTFYKHYYVNDIEDYFANYKVGKPGVYTLKAEIKIGNGVREFWKNIRGAL